MSCDLLAAFSRRREFDDFEAPNASDGQTSERDVVSNQTFEEGCEEVSLSRRSVANDWSPSAVALACNIANNWRVSMPNAWSSSILILHAVAIQRDLEDVLVNSSSIRSSKDKGSVMLMALVGSAERRRLIQPTPPGNHHHKHNTNRPNVSCLQTFHQQYLYESYTMDIQWTSKLPPVIKPSGMV